MRFFIDIDNLYDYIILKSYFLTLYIEREKLIAKSATHRFLNSLTFDYEIFDNLKILFNLLKNITTLFKFIIY